MENRESSGSSVAALIDPTDSGIVHMVEHDVRRHLMAHHELAFHSLVVRRVSGGICLEGVIDRTADDLESLVASIVREIDGIGEIHNHLVVQDVPRPQKG